MKRVKNNYIDTSLRIIVYNVPVMEFVVALLLFATWVAAHGLALHVCKPRSAVADIVYPAPHAEQSTVPSASHNVASLLPPLTVGVPFGHVHVLPEH